MILSDLTPGLTAIMFLRADAEFASGNVPPDDAGGRAPALRLPRVLSVMAGLLPDDVLHRTAVEAQRIDVPPDVLLLAEGLATADSYYRQLAAGLGLPFAEQPLRPHASATEAAALAMGVLPLQVNRHGWRYLLAPRGPALTAFLSLAPQDNDAPLPPVAITTPDRLEALVRYSHREAMLRAASHGLPDWNSSLSARGGLSDRQAMVCASLAIVVGLAAFVVPGVCLAGIQSLFFVAFLLLVGLRLAATGASAEAPCPPDLPRIPDRDLPIYTIVVPLFRETRVVKQLVAALDRLDYPPAKLDVILMVEANDPATLDALDALGLPGCYRVLVAPRGAPQTKPRALNFALQAARGAYLVVYDAEDEPEPGQLREALAQFAAKPWLACLQARLAIDNTADSWLTRLFTIEYAALFDVINPGLAALGLPVPLGGTSNHFPTAMLRQINGWDAWNVTEDIDLGIRLARFGLRVETLRSTTFEEAPNTVRAWLAQRRRWLKGWMVTLGTHSRAPLRLAVELGAGGTLAVVALVLGTVASCLLGPLLFAAFAIRLCSGALLHPQTAMDAVWSGLSCSLLTLGTASAIWPALLGLRRRGWMRLAGWLGLLPVYLLLLSVAAWGAAIEVAGFPYTWVKTEHGRAKRRARLVPRR